MEAAAKQAVGSRYVLESMKYAQGKTWEAVNRLAQRVRPGMLESEAKAECHNVLNEMGMDRIWHPILVRFGENTLKVFKQPSEGDLRLKEDDIFFVDLGVVWDGHEGDAGATFVVGNDAGMKACADAAKTVFDEVEHHWRTTRAGGKALYDFAEQRAAALGWRLNRDIKGHRVSDFPHAIYKAGNLGDFADCPDAGLRIVEIQLAHPTRPFGAFYQDLLV
jgi:Xaa-Pro aminopeptidase